MTSQSSSLNYPATRRTPVVEQFGDIRVEDPYRWLEDGERPSTRQWVKEQDRLARKVLEASPAIGPLRRRFRTLVRYDLIPPRALLPVREPPNSDRTRFFWLRRSLGRKQPALRYRDGLGGPTRVALDPQLVDPGGTTNILDASPSWDGSRVLYGLSVHGSDRTGLRVRDLAAHRSFDRIPNVRYATFAWRHDGTGFYYSTWPEPGWSAAKRAGRVFFHRIGTSSAEDPSLFGEGLDIAQGVADLVIDRGDDHLVVFVEKLSESTDLYCLDLRNGARARPLAHGLGALFLGDGNSAVRDGRLLTVTEHRAPNRRVVGIPLDDPRESAWSEPVPETDDVLEALTVAGERLVLYYLHDGCSRIAVRPIDGAGEREAMLPASGSVMPPSGEGGGNETTFSFSSCGIPRTLYRLSPSSASMQVLDRSPIPVPPPGIETRWVRYPSKDGSEVRMFLVRRKGPRPNAPGPALLEAYGGFGISITPFFDIGILPFLQDGGTYAVAQIRGGGEQGRAWHDAGRRERKQNTFDDFIAAAEWLTREGYTDPAHLAIRGASNGGLLVGAAITQRPELFRAAVCRVPVLDMLRYQRFDGGVLWAAEYGSADDPAMFPYLWAYSPYHRVREGTEYPAVLLVTADTDTRVNPMHARKMAAALQAATSSGRPVLLRTEQKAGHGFGKSVDQIVETLATQWAFLYDQLGVRRRT